jgi:hypothetical protein
MYIQEEKNMAGVWYDFNLHFSGKHDKCEALYDELSIACDGRYDDDNDIEPDDEFSSFRDGAQTQGLDCVMSGHPIHFQTDDYGISDEPYDPFFPYIEKHPDVSLLFEGIAETDSSRASFYFVFENGKITDHFYYSYDFSEYDDDEDCIKARNDDMEETVQPFVKQWCKEAKKHRKYYKPKLSQ